MKQIEPLAHGQLCKLLWELGGDYLQITALGTTPAFFAFNLSWGKFKRRKRECGLADGQAAKGLWLCDCHIGWQSCLYS